MYWSFHTHQITTTATRETKERLDYGRRISTCRADTRGFAISAWPRVFFVSHYINLRNIHMYNHPRYTDLSGISRNIIANGA